MNGGELLTRGIGQRSEREGCKVPTAYFFAGGSARWPFVKAEAYSLFLEMRFSWIGVAMFRVGTGDWGSWRLEVGLWIVYISVCCLTDVTILSAFLVLVRVRGRYIYDHFSFQSVGNLLLD